MEEELKAVLAEHFGDLKHFHAVLVIAANLLVALSSLGIGFWTRSELNKIRAKQDRLNKRFEKHHDLQISAVKLIYPLIVKLDFASEQLQNPFIYQDVKVEIAERINEWVNSFNELSKAFYENDLYFEKEISEHIEKYIALHKELFLRFSENRTAIEQLQSATKEEFPNNETISFTKEQLLESAKGLKKVKKEFANKNPEIRKFIKAKFKTILEPKK